MKIASSVFVVFVALVGCCWSSSPVSSASSADSSSPQPGPGVVFVYYQTQWTAPNMHYSSGGPWTPVPGLPMDASLNASMPAAAGWWGLGVPANQLTFVFNDGQGHWDNNGGRNYGVQQAGIYAVANGQLTVIAIMPAGCPSSCSGHGACDQQRGQCVCDPGYFAADCSGVCPGGPDHPCGGHGVCSDGAQGSGQCTCSAAWATCSAASPCGTDTSSDASNCGSCGAACPASSAGVQFASCSAGSCSLSCQPGFVACPATRTCSPASTGCVPPPLPGCNTFSDGVCNGSTIVFPESFSARQWQTPPSGDALHLPSYQNMDRLVGYAWLQYAPDMSSAAVTVNATSRDPSASLLYAFGSDAPQASPVRQFARGFAGVLSVRVLSSDGSSLQLEDIDFAWNAPPVVPQGAGGDYRGGQKGAVVEMFGWPHDDVALECEALGKMGYMGVRVFPAMEQLMAWQPFNNELNPWYFMYQPVSYRLQGRMGTRDQLRKAIQTCRANGVRVYADAVINHMVGSGNDANPLHRTSNGACVTWGAKNSSAFGAASPFYSQGFTYAYQPGTGQPPAQEFPAVPYGPLDFHCERVLNSWTDPLDLNAGWLTGLTDLNTERDSVRERIAAYMTDLLSIGFSGFRVDAAKHIHPDDLVAIFSKVRRNMGGALPADFITWLEVLLGGEAQLLMCNTASGYNYAQYLQNQLLAAGFSAADVAKVKIWNSGYPKEPDADCGMVARTRNVVQNDDHDQQSGGSTSRDMGDYGSVLVIDLDIPKHRGFEVQLFQNPRGAADNNNDFPIRAVLSSYYFSSGQNNAHAIPDGYSDCSLCVGPYCGPGQCNSVPKAVAHDPNSCGYEGPVYTRVHRDRSIILAMRAWMGLSTSVTNAQLGLPDRCT